LAPVAVGDGVARIFALVGDCAVVVTLVVVRDAPVVVGLGVSGIEPDGLVQVGDAAVVVALVNVGNAPVEVGAGVAGIEPDSLVVVGKGASRSPRAD